MAAIFRGEKPEKIVVSNIGEQRTLPGTLNEALVKFYRDSAFTSFRKSYRDQIHDQLENFRAGGVTERNHMPRGERQLATLKTSHLRDILREVTSDSSHNHLLRALRNFFKFCVAEGLIELNPTHELERRKLAVGEGYPTFEEEHIEQYRSHWPLGTQERLVLEIMLNTGLRGRSDAARLGPHHIKNGIITIQPRKTRNSTGATVTVPMLPDLKAALDAMPKPPANVAPTTFLYGANGQMLPSSTFGQWFGRSVDAAGLPKVEVDEKLKNLRAHGLRKSCAVRLADAGCDVLTIGAVIGDEKLENIAIYIRKRSRAKASLAGMGKLMDMLALKRAAA